MLAFCSAVLLGFYDVCKKQSLRENAVIPVLTLNTLFSSLLFSPFIVLSLSGGLDAGSAYYAGSPGGAAHWYVFLKSLIVLSSWIFGYFAMKHLPLTIVGPVNATRPVMVLVGALLVFSERLNGYQWVGVAFAVLSFFLLSRSGKREGIDFRHDRWVLFLVLAAALGAVSGLYDKFLMGHLGLKPLFVQSWYNLYQLAEMSFVLLCLWWPRRKSGTPFRWRWSIPLISLFLSMADFAYFYSLSCEGAMISVVSMVRRGSVVVSFLCGALFFHEKNLRGKAVDLLLVLLGMFFLYLGSR